MGLSPGRSSSQFHPASGPRGRARGIVAVTKAAKVEMRSLLADVGGIQQYFSGEFFLESETPGLLIGNVPADLLYGSYCVESNVVERAERAARSRRNAARCRIDKRAGSVFQSVVRRCMIDIQSGQPGRLNVETLITPRAGAGG